MELNFVMNNEDLEHIIESIEKNYLFSNEVDKANWEHSVELFKEKGDLNIRNTVELISSLNDAHTYLINRDIEYIYKCDFIWDKDRLYFIDDTSITEKSVKEVSYINEVKITKIIDIYKNSHPKYSLSSLKIMVLEDIKKCNISKFSNVASLNLKFIDNTFRIFKRINFSDYLKEINIRNEVSNEFKPLVNIKIDEETVLIKILGFNFLNIANLFRDELIIVNKYKNIIFDIRHNGGGSISNAKEIVSHFSDSTIDLGYSILIKDGNTVQQTIHGKENLLKNKKVSLFINEFTMSSAEFIFALGLICSKNDVTIFGRKSAGMKNQAKIFEINNKLLLQVTVKKYVNFKNSFSEGIIPDVYVKNEFDEPYFINDYFIDEYKRFQSERKC